MAGSTFGNIFRITTWGESHGKALGVVIDGCPAGLKLSEEDIQPFLNRRKPGGNPYTTPRSENDAVEILSGVFEGYTTGSPISMMIQNTNQRSKDYGEIANIYRPGHADFTFDQKYGFFDYRGGGRSSGRETAARVAGGAVAIKILKEIGVEICAYTHSIGPVEINPSNFNKEHILLSKTAMPDEQASALAEEYLKECIRKHDSSGGQVACIIKNCPIGLGDPVFDKLDANLAKAMMSIGAVKAVEIGDGVAVSKTTGTQNNDCLSISEQKIIAKTNHAGGILGGISNGEDILIKTHFKPTPSISSEQHTINKQGEETNLSILGRHDPIIVPRAVVVVESMAACTLLDLLLSNMSARLDSVKKIYIHHD